MLILTRKLGERIRIGEDIWVTVVDIDRGKIRLGINAPSYVNVMREELLPVGSQFNHNTEERNDAKANAQGKAKGQLGRIETEEDEE